MTPTTIHIAGAIAAFALVGGWGAAFVAKTFAGRGIPIASAIAICAALGAWAFAATGWTNVFAISLGLGWVLFVLAIVDALVFRLPDLLTLPLAIAGIGVTLFLPQETVASHLAGAATGFCVFASIGWIYVHLRGREGLGLGDAKLAAAAGAWLGWTPLPSFILISCATGFVWIAAMAVVRGRSALRERIPFGVALALGFWIVWLYGALEFPGGIV